MAKTGFVIHNGIKQIFTSGPSSGNPVVNGYAINGTLQGPTVNYAQSFVVNSLETISAGGRVWVRKEEDQTKCAPDCNAPTVSTLVKDCSTNIFTVTSTNVNATNSPNTRIEVSTDNFATILSTFNRSNSNGTNNYNIDLSNSGIVRGTTIYFRLVNLCSPTLSSSPSSIVSGSCEVVSCCTPTLNGVSIDGGVLYVGWTLGAGSCLPVSAVTVQSSTDQITWTGNTGSSTSPRTFGIPTVTTYYRVVSNCLGGGTSAASNVLSYTVTPPPPPPVATRQSLAVSGGATAIEACTDYNSVSPLNTKTIWFSDLEDFMDVATIYRAETGDTKATKGWYSDGVTNRYWSGTAFTSLTACRQ